MRYHNITKDDMLNGEGLRVVLWVSGCAHHCEGCHNAVTWDPEGGLAFDAAAEEELFCVSAFCSTSGLFLRVCCFLSLRLSSCFSSEIRI